MELSEEEKKVIKDFLELREIHSNDSMSVSYLSIYQNAVKKMLNLVDKQQKEIEHELNQRKYWRDNFYKRQKEIEKYKRYFKLAISDLKSEGYMQMPYENIEEYYSQREDIV